MPDCLLLLPHAHSHLPSPFPKKTGIPSEEISERSQIIAESEEFQFSSEFSSEKYKNPLETGFRRSIRSAVG